MGQLQDIHQFLMEKAEEHFISSIEGKTFNIQEWFKKMSSEVDLVQMRTETDFDDEAVLMYLWACFCNNHDLTSGCEQIRNVEVVW